MKPKFIFTTILIAMFITIRPAQGQEIKETVEPLSAKAVKGYLDDANFDDNNALHVTYKMKIDKKSDVVSYENYSFDKDLKFLGITQASAPKDDHADYERTFYYAYVGGTTSFDVLSMKLKLYKVVQLRTWNQARQYYTTKKTISKEDIKPKNDDGKVYLGYASYNSSEEKNTDILVLAKIESKSKTEDNTFYLLTFNSSLEQKIMPLDLGGNFSLVYTGQLKNDNVVMVFAPAKGSADISQYLYVQYDLQGNEVYRTNFKSPASALLITDMSEDDNNVYFIGGSTKDGDPYEKVYSEYAPIYNPGWSNVGENKLNFKWEKAASETINNMHILKFSGNKLILASTNPVKDFKSKFKTVKGDKGASVYKGKKFNVTTFYVTPDEEILVAGQLTGTITSGVVAARVYFDLICLHFDSQGNLKAQYGLGRSESDKKSEVFQIPQDFYLSDNGNIYWEVLDAKGIKGYASFYDAYNGSPTFYPQYFPRIVTINLKNTEMTSLKQLGGGKYYVNQRYPGIFDAKANTITYIGRDLKYKKLWVGQAKL